MLNDAQSLLTSFSDDEVSVSDDSKRIVLDIVDSTLKNLYNKKGTNLTS